MAETKKTDIYQAVGRRKTATARVRIFTGTGDFTINDHPIFEYFSRRQDKIIFEKPLILAGLLGKFSGSVKVEGSGLSSQLGAVVHGLSRSIIKFDEKLKPTLKKAGLLTRDPRAKERRKMGNAQKARKGKQSPKR